MRLLIDDCLPRALKRLLHGHTCRTVQEMAWSGIKNGALLSLAEGEFDALITIDQGLEYQQNLKERRIAILLLVSRSNQIEDLAPIVPAALTALETILPGQVVRIGESWSGFPACLHRRLSYPGAPISPVAKADQNLRNLQVNIFKASKEEDLGSLHRDSLKEVLGLPWGPAAIKLLPRNYAPTVSSAGTGIGTRKLLART
jgi:hypothetical protein